MNKKIYLLLTMLLLAFALLGCGGEEYTDEGDTAPEVEEVAEVPADPVDEEPIETEPSITTSDNDAVYVHPSGLFSLTEPGELVDEGADYALFSGSDQQVFAFATEATDAVDESTLEPIATSFLADVLVANGLVNDFVLYTDDSESVSGGYLIPFDFSSADYAEGQGDLYLQSDGTTLIALTLLTEDYDAVSEGWRQLLGTLETGSGAASEENEPSSGETSSSGEGDPSTSPEAGAADSGFRPTVNGFSFENYGNESVSANLTPAEVQRMFGDQVCASLSGGDCILTPPAEQWMDQINGYMDGGHCEGMATLSLLMYSGQVSAQTFGGDTAFDLSLDNEALQREIAYWWTTQSVSPAANFRINESPNAVVDQLLATYSDPNATETWTIGIYQRDGSGGHAITPFAVEDQGDGTVHILVYDNNYPGETRYVIVDRNANTWQYQASTNPNEPSELYEGDADTQSLEIIPTSNRLGTQECEFCSNDGQSSRGGGVAMQAQQYNQIWLEGDADLLITDEEGHRIGYDQGQFVNEIPGAKTEDYKFLGIEVWDLEKEPVYMVPLGVQFSITVDASRATEGITSTVTMIGPGYTLVVADLYLDPGASDVIGVSPDGRQLTYSTEYNDAPDMIFGIERPEADYEFIVAALDIESGAEFLINLDVENGLLSINTDNTTEYGVYEIVMSRIDDDGEVIFQNNDIYLEPGDTTYLKYLEWQGPGTSLFIDIDYGSDGSIDETIELVDEYISE